MAKKDREQKSTDLRILAISRNANFSLRFNQAGYEFVEVVNDCRRAVERLEDQTYDILAVQNVREFIGQIEKLRERDQKKIRLLPFLAFGGRQKGIVMDAIQNGAADFATNRVVPGHLRRKIEHILNNDIPKRELSDALVGVLPKVLQDDQIEILFWPDSPEEVEKLTQDLTVAQENEQKKKSKKMSEKEIESVFASADNDKGKLIINKKGLVENDKPIISYDYKHPQRVSKAQQRTLENLHASLARALASAYSTMHRSVVDCDIAFVDQTTYAEFIMSLSNPSCSYTFTIEPLSGPAIFDFSLPVAYSFIDRQFGGTGGNPPQEARPLTSLERTVMSKVITRTLHEFEMAWAPLLKIRVSDTELETNPEFMQIAAPSDTVVLIAFEVNSQHASGLVNLCLPYFTLEPVMGYLNPQTWASRERSGSQRMTHSQIKQKRFDQLKGIPAEVTATWGRGSLSPEALAQLQEGDTLVLNTRADDPSIVFVEDRPMFLAKPGQSEKNNHAIEIIRALSDEELRQYM
ncbi:MAG: flagellar motor switch protein FliM [Candidatus Latescibacteria bacterium]|nr:flagellar motor switch protein FliM [Candidatus Latescibacterota bacterium]